MRARLVTSMFVAVLAIALPRASQAPVPVAGTGAISGTVRSAVSGQPLAGAVVSISGGIGVALVRGNERQLTDAQGRFVFRNLPVSLAFTVRATRTGYIDAEFGQAAPLGPAGRIALAEGQWFNRADVQMWKPGAISGRVVDEHGDAAGGVYVRVLAQEMIAGQLRLLAGGSAKTDDRGEYRISGLLPSRYLIVVPSVQSTVPYAMPLDQDAAQSQSTASLERLIMLSGLGAPAPRVDAGLDLDTTNRLIVGNYMTPPPANGRTQTYPMTFYPNVTSAAGAVPIDLGPAEERRGVDVALRPVPAARVAGRVVAPFDQVAGLLLRLMPAGLEELGAGSEAATTFVDAEGRFVFLNVPAGSYTIDARRAMTQLRFDPATPQTGLPTTPGAPIRSSSSGSLVSGPDGTGWMTTDGSASDRFWTITPVTVGNADLDNVAVTLSDGATLRGRMLFEGSVRAVATAVSGGIAGGASAPVMVVDRPPLPERMPTVYAEPASANVSLGLFSSTSPAVDGDTDTFAITGLRAGEYVLRVRSGAGRYMVKSIQVGGRDVTNSAVTMAPGRHISDIVVTFTSDMPVISGKVDGDGSAVIVFPVEKDQWTGYGLTPTRLLSQPAVAGGFRFEALPAGEYFVVAVDVAQIKAWQDPRFLARAEAVATRVRVGWGEARDVALKVTRIQ